MSDKKYIALVCLDSRDFQAYFDENDSNLDSKQNFKSGKVTSGNNTYLCVSNKHHLRGYMIDGFIETEIAFKSKDYNEIRFDIDRLMKR